MNDFAGERFLIHAKVRVEYIFSIWHIKQNCLSQKYQMFKLLFLLLIFPSLINYTRFGFQKSAQRFELLSAAWKPNQRRVFETNTLREGNGNLLNPFSRMNNTVSTEDTSK